MTTELNLETIQNDARALSEASAKLEEIRQIFARFYPGFELALVPKSQELSVASNENLFKDLPLDRQILLVLTELGGRASVDDIFSLLREKGSTLKRPTLYSYLSKDDRFRGAGERGVWELVECGGSQNG